MLLFFKKFKMCNKWAYKFRFELPEVSLIYLIYLVEMLFGLAKTMAAKVL